MRKRIPFGLGLVVCLGLAAANVAVGQPKKEDREARLVVQVGHSHNVLQAVFSPDEKQILTASWDGTARIWDVATGKELIAFHGHAGDADDEEEEANEDKMSGVRAAAFSPDGKSALTVGNDGMARLWDVRTGKELATFTSIPKVIKFGAFSPDGQRIVTTSQGKGSGGPAQVWEVRNGKPLFKLTESKERAGAVVFSSDGKHLMGFEDFKKSRAACKVCTWDAKTGKLLKRVTIPGTEKAATLSADGRFALTSHVKLGFTLWDLETGKKKHDLAQQIYGPNPPAAFSADGKRCLTGGLQSIRLWDVETGKTLQTLATADRMEIVNSIVFTKDGKQALSGHHAGKHLGKAILWDLSSGKVLRSFQGQGGKVLSVAQGADGKLILTNSLITDMKRKAHLWNVQTGQVRALGSGVDVKLSPDGKQILIGTSKIWKSMDVQTGKELFTLKAPAAQFSQDGKRILTGPPTVALLDAQTGAVLRSLTLQNSKKRKAGGVLQTALSNDGRYAVLGRVVERKNSELRLWDTQTGQDLPLPDFDARLLTLAFAPDGTRFLAAGYIPNRTTGFETQVRDTLTGKVLLSIPQKGVVSAAFSPDGARVLTASGRERIAQLWDARTGKKLLTFKGHTGFVKTVAFLPNGKRVLTASWDQTTRLWDAETGNELCKLVSFANGTWAVVDAAGRYDASGAGDVEGLHWVVNHEPIALKQLKERYYEPGLLAKHLGLSKEPLRQVEAFKEVGLFAAATLAEPTPDGKLAIDLANQGGGIGKVQVFVNGRELVADARAPGVDVQAAKTSLTVDLARAPSVKPGQENVIEVVTWNADGYLSSRGIKSVWKAPGKAEEQPLELYAIVAGVSEYANPALNLRYSAKDAEDIARALTLGGKRLFGANKVNVTLLTHGKNAAGPPTRANIEKAFEAARKARPGDVLIVYLAGHGVSLSQGSDLYCYLTADARNADVTALSDPALLKQYTVTSTELTEWIKQIPALKQVMILDTCAAGAAARKLTEQRNVTGDQIRAIERLKDRTGFHVLMGCAADKVSYEATQFAQGLLTHALLKGMRGAALDREEFVDVSKLFQYAADEVPNLAKNIGGIQKPIIAAPRGTSFDVGRLTKDDKPAIPLAIPRPLLLRPLLLNPDEADDNLGLMPLLRKQLATDSSSGARGQGGAVFVDADEMPGAVRPSGTYSVRNNTVRVRLLLKRDGLTLSTLDIEGPQSDLTGLVGQMAGAITKAVR